MSGGARSVELALCLCDITFQAMIQVDLNIYISISHTDEISAMKYISIPNP